MKKFFFSGVLILNMIFLNAGLGLKNLAFSEGPSQDGTAALPSSASSEKGSSAGAESEEAQAPGSEKMIRKKAHKIQEGDKLRVKIYPEDEFIKGGDMEVSSEGTITLALVGKVNVRGKKVVEAEEEIVRLLSQDYLVSPVVVIEVAERIEEKEKKSLAVLGQVKKPGTYDFPADEKLTLLQVISMAGGFTEVANARKIKIIRKDKGGATRVIKVINVNAESVISGKSPDLELEPDDVIHVAESFF